MSPLTPSSSLAADSGEIEEMIADAEAHANDDKERREAAEIRNQADQLSHNIGKQLEEHGDKLSDDERAPIDEALEGLKTLLASDDPSTEDLKAATEALSTSSQVLGQKIYEASQADAEIEAADASDDDGVVEAEVVDDNGATDDVVEADVDDNGADDDEGRFCGQGEDGIVKQANF